MDIQLVKLARRWHLTFLTQQTISQTWDWKYLGTVEIMECEESM